MPVVPHMKDGAFDRTDGGAVMIRTTNSGGGVRNLSDEQLKKLVESLNSLHDGELGIPLLVACGERAIRPLRDFLLHGRASSIFIPRQRVVRALAELGAKDVLLEYLAAEKNITDPCVRQGEEAVENTAARALAAWHSEDVFCVLLQKLSTRHLAGIIETLGRFRRSEPLPYYIRALENDFCRHSAEQAIGKLGDKALSDLIDAARTPDPSGTCESRSSVSRRRSALRLLSDLQLSRREWRKLIQLLDDRDPEIAARAGSVALAVADRQDKQRAVCRLIEVLPRANWLLQSEIETWLFRSSAIAQEAVEKEVTRRQAVPHKVQAKDNVLRLLLTVKGRIDKALGGDATSDFLTEG
jgi:HEAT repeat protein